MVDALDLGSSARKGVGVRVPPCVQGKAPFIVTGLISFMLLGHLCLLLAVIYCSIVVCLSIVLICLFDLFVSFVETKNTNKCIFSGGMFEPKKENICS